MPITEKEKSGAGLAISCYLMWGLVPLFWKQLTHIDVDVILFHRVLWALFFAVIAGTITRQFKWSDFKISKRDVLILLSSSLLIGFNWGVFIWAMANNMVMQASLGYFINPFISILLGFLVFGERFNSGQKLAIGFSVSGVVVLTVLTGQVPWVALALALSFGLYGLAKKFSSLPAPTSMMLECLLLVPLVFFYAGGMQAQLFNYQVKDMGLLFAGGLVTLAPLLAFSGATKKIPLSWVGVFQFIAPTMKFFIAWLVLGEVLSAEKLVSFVFIWIGVVIFIYQTVKKIYAKASPNKTAHTLGFTQAFIKTIKGFDKYRIQYRTLKPSACEKSQKICKC